MGYWVCTVCECVSEGVCVCTTFVSNNYVPSGTHSSGSTFSPSSSWPTHTHSLTHSHSHNSSWKWGLFKCCLSAWLENGYLPVRGKEGEESGGGLARNECKRHVGKAHRRSDSTHLPPTTQHPHTHYPPSSPHCVWLSATGLNKTLKAQNNDADACQVKLKTETPKALDCRTSRTNRK